MNKINGEKFGDKDEGHLFGENAAVMEEFYKLFGSKEGYDELVAQQLKMVDDDCNV